MEVFLALAGLAGLTLLLQSKPLPSKAEAEKAFEKLDKDPIDPDANTIFGKYKAFVMGDYEGAMPYLVHSKDATLKALAEHELDATYTATPQQKVGMGDEWVTAAKNFKALSPAFYDRASQWYVQAWPGLDAVWKDRSRTQGRKLAVSRPVGVARKGVPTGWLQDVGVGGRPPVSDGNVARSGSYSIKIPAADEKVKGSLSALTSDLFPVSGKNYEFSAYTLTDGTENAADRIYIRFFDQAGAQNTATPSSFFPVDVPFWQRTAIKGEIPSNAVRAQIVVVLYSKKGSMWIDDISFKADGKELLKNGSFEDR